MTRPLTLYEAFYLHTGARRRVEMKSKVPHSTRRCENHPNCALLFGGICIQRLKVVLSLRWSTSSSL